MKLALKVVVFLNSGVLFGVMNTLFVFECSFRRLDC